MAMQNFIASLRKRPYDERIAIAGGAGVAVTAVLFGLWLLTWFLSVPTIVTESQAASAAQSYEQLQKASNDISYSVQALGNEYQHAKQAIEALGALGTTPPGAFVNLTTDAQGNVQLQQVDVQNERVLQP